MTGEWSLLAMATYLDCDISHACRIANGQARQAVMRLLDPSSCAKAYVQPPRPTYCLHCDRGTNWVRLQFALGAYGQSVFYCPQCGSSG